MLPGKASPLTSGSAVMNSEYADYGGVLQLGVPSQDMPKAIYYMALAKIDDKDRKMSFSGSIMVLNRSQNRLVSIGSPCADSLFD